VFAREQSTRFKPKQINERIPLDFCGWWREKWRTGEEDRERWEEREEEIERERGVGVEEMGAEMDCEGRNTEKQRRAIE